MLWHAGVLLPGRDGPSKAGQFPPTYVPREQAFHVQINQLPLLSNIPQASISSALNHCLPDLPCPVFLQESQGLTTEALGLASWPTLACAYEPMTCTPALLSQEP